MSTHSKFLESLPVRLYTHIEGVQNVFFNASHNIVKKSGRAKSNSKCDKSF